VALILDVPGLARIAELSSMAGTKRASELKAEQDGKRSTTRQSLLLFQNGPEESCAVPLHLVGRVEQIKASDIEIVGGKKVIQYRGGNLPVFALEEVASVDMLEDREELIVLVFGIGGREVGLLAAPPVDALEVDVEVDDQTLRQPGISGSAIIKDRTTLLVDIHEVIETLNPQWFERRRTAAAASEPAPETGEGGDITSSILLAEDSDFFRRQVKKIIEEDGHVVVGVGDGQEAWRFLSEHPKRFRLVVTDLEMPNLDGFELTRKIKADERLSHLPVIALTSLASEEDMAKGSEVGIDDYQIKLDKDHLLQSIGRYMQQAS